ncbi:MAG: hypothetical protein Q9223_004336, partial [Gallowayella weberi]
MAFTEEEMAQYQRMSNDYVPDTQGPLISMRQSSQNITAEYAQADSIYVHKTTALAHQFSEYRTVKGDGNCGWRALAFGYFEALLQSADPNRVLMQVTRLTSLNNLLESVGYPRAIYEDFTDETLQLLKDTANTLPSHDGGASLLAKFNDAGVCNAIIMHFRLITSAWMKTHPESYVHYTENQSISEYCSTHIEPHAVEIENLGLQACIDAIIKPAGIAVQVLVLDRSPGVKVNQLDWPAEPSSANALYIGPQTIRLLYRPYMHPELIYQSSMMLTHLSGHYDILYKPQDLTLLSAATVPNPQIRLMSDPQYMSSSNICYSHSPHQLDIDQFCLPGFISAGISTTPFSTIAYSDSPIYAPSSLSMTSAPTDTYSVPYSEPAPTISQTPIREGPWNADSFRPSHYQVEDKFRHEMP